MSESDGSGANAYGVAARFWVSPQWPMAWSLTAIVVLLTIAIVPTSFSLIAVLSSIYTYLQRFDAPGFYAAIARLFVIVLALVALSMLQMYVSMTLQLRWRRWLTDQYLRRWLSEDSFFRMRFSTIVDNPDQRISEDVRIFTTNTLTLFLGLLSAALSLAVFASALWIMSGPLAFEIGAAHIVIPGYMFWVAVAYAIVGTLLAHLVGNPLISLNNRQQRVEADFRFALVRTREETDAIALSRGENAEITRIGDRFGALYSNSQKLISSYVRFTAYRVFIDSIAGFFPMLAGAPRYFAHAMPLGGLMQMAGAFGQVNAALTWFVNNYPVFAEWRAAANRLRALELEFHARRNAPAGIQAAAGSGSRLRLDAVAVNLPAGAALVQPTSLELREGEAVLLRGPTGSGKSTLFRVFAGLWPFGAGTITPPGARTMFLPQRPYLPIGALKATLTFPEPAAAHEDSEVAAGLAAVGLERLAARLNEEGHWSQFLSPGEQQRLAIVRALLFKPDWLFLDEATSAMDEEQEALLYRLLAARLPRTTIVSIGHRTSLFAHHARVLTMREGRAGGMFVEEEPLPLRT